MSTHRRMWALTTLVAAATARMKMKSKEAVILAKEVAGGTSEAGAVMRASGYKD